MQHALTGATGTALALAYDAALSPFITATLVCAVGALFAFVTATRLTAETARHSMAEQLNTPNPGWRTGSRTGDGEAISVCRAIRVAESLLCAHLSQDGLAAKPVAQCERDIRFKRYRGCDACPSDWIVSACDHAAEIEGRGDRLDPYAKIAPVPRRKLATSITHPQ